MLILVFLNLLFGLWFAYKTYSQSHGRWLPPIVIKSCVFAYLVLLAGLSLAPPVALIFGIYTPIFIFIGLEWLIIQKRLQNFKKQLPILLDSVIARMKMGHSFRTALDLGIESIHTPTIKEYFTELRDCMIYSQNISHIPKDLSFAFKIFQLSDQDPRPISRLSYVRHNLKVEAQFQKKTDQVLLQIRFQSLILTGLYFMLLLFALFYYGTQFLALMFASAFLFFTGLGFVFTRNKIKWTL